MRYLIIGGTSVFGKPLVERLLAKTGTKKIIATSLEAKNEYLEDEVEWIQLDLRDAKETEDVVRCADADIIFDFATQDSVAKAWRDPKETVDVNVIGTINLLNAVKNLDKKPRLIIGGSGEEYGQISFDKQPITEDEQPRPVNIYGASKASQTMFTKLYARAYGLDVIIVRTFNETSVAQDDHFAISSFCHQFVKIKKGEQPAIIHVGNINNVRDFTDVRDLAKAFDMVAAKGKSGETYNAARGEGTSLRQIIESLEKITGIRVQIITDRSKMRPNDAPSVIADVEKIKKDVGWKAEVTVEDTLKSLLVGWGNR